LGLSLSSRATFIAVGELKISEAIVGTAPRRQRGEGEEGQREEWTRS
jgi:hypothetical protein